MGMNYFKKLILLITVGFAFSVSAEGLFSLPLLYSVKNPRQFNETSRYISGLRYSWVFSAYFPDHVQELVGKWHLQAGAGWLHTIPRKISSAKQKENSNTAVNSEGKQSDKSKKETKKVKTFISYYPAVVSVEVKWELDQLHYVRPAFGVGYALNNPLDDKTLLQHSFLDKKSYFITAGLLFSFDIVDSNFSHRMNYEYNIRDMGLFAEYQKYYSLGAKDQSHWGINVGLFMAL